MVELSGLQIHCNMLQGGGGGGGGGGQEERHGREGEREG